VALQLYKHFTFYTFLRPIFIFPHTVFITYVQALTVQIAFDLRSGLRCGDAVASNGSIKVKNSRLKLG